MKTHKMPDGSMMAGAKHKSKPVKKSGGKGSDAMKKKMAALRAMRKKK
jgi:hypothetical protein